MSGHRTMVQRGYSIVEVMVYCTLLLILVYTLGLMLRQLTEYTRLSGDVTTSILRQKLFFDAMRRDMLVADDACSFWDENNLVLRKSTIDTKRSRLKTITKDIGFFVRDGKLFRVTGSYSFLQQKWLGHRHVSLCYQSRFAPVKSMRWKLSCSRDRVLGVSIFLITGARQEREDYVRLRNGSISWA